MERRGFLARVFGGFLVALGLRPKPISAAEWHEIADSIKEAYPKGAFASMWNYEPKSRIWDDIEPGE
jgi:hypothetical protein